MYKEIKSNIKKIVLGITIPFLFTPLALSQEVDYKNLGKQSYLERKVLGVSKDYDMVSKGFMFTEYKDIENKDRGFRRLQLYNQKGDLVEIIDFGDDGWVMNDSDTRKDKDDTIDGVCITNFLEGKFRRPISKEGDEGKSFYEEATKTYKDKVQELTAEAPEAGKERPDKNLLK